MRPQILFFRRRCTDRAEVHLWQSRIGATNSKAWSRPGVAPFGSSDCPATRATIQKVRVKHGVPYKPRTGLVVVIEVRRERDGWVTTDDPNAQLDFNRWDFGHLVRNSPVAKVSVPRATTVNLGRAAVRSARTAMNGFRAVFGDQMPRAADDVGREEYRRFVKSRR